MDLSPKLHKTAAPTASVDQSLTFGARYVAWLGRWRAYVLGSALLLTLASGVFAAKLPVYADFSYLLPENTESVQHLRALQKRARVLGTVMVAVQGADAAERHRVSTILRDKITALGPELVSSVTFDRRAGSVFAWEHRYLFADLKDLEHLKHRLDETLATARRKANPLLMDLEDDVDAPAKPALATQDPAFSRLVEKLDELKAKKDAPNELVSETQKLQMMVVQTPFSAGDIARDKALLSELGDIIAEAQSDAPKLRIGMAGDIVTSFEEQQSILSGMLEATAVTLVLVLGALGLYYRSVYGMFALGASLLVGTLMTFALTKLTVGHLNVATAFLASIVLGNGINFGIMLLARQLEVIRHGLTGEKALLAAVTSTARGTFAAAATACVAYLSLMLTTFRGFRDFGWIAGTGMIFCWATAYTVLPALLSYGLSKGFLKAHQEPALGALLARLLPRRHGLTAAFGVMTLVVTGAIVFNEMRQDPFEQDLRNLRSDSHALLEERGWMDDIDHAFGKGISGGFVIGTKTREEEPAVVRRLHEANDGKSEKEQLFSRINALDDFLPPEQTRKLTLLHEIREMLSDRTLAHLPADQRETIRSLRPPKDLAPVAIDDVPANLAWPFTEADGTRGRLILAMGSWGYDLWNRHDIMAFADKVRGLDLGSEALLGGSAFVFADMLRLIEHDGPRATLAAAVAATAVVLLLLRASRFALVTLLCVALGTLSMLAICGAVGLKINFLDFVALPITLGIGIDYAVNICARAREEGRGGARRALAGAGAAVCLSSYTTIVGYGSLLLSSNRGIRSFGSAAILGEMTCLLAGLFLAPALLELMARGHSDKKQASKVA